jgi:proline dehydrogenase
MKSLLIKKGNVSCATIDMDKKQQDGSAIMEDRWSLPDLDETVQWCRKRNGQGIRSIFAVMAEYSLTHAESEQAVLTQLAGIRTIGTSSCGASFSVKPSAIGMLYDYSEYTQNLSVIAQEARALGVPLEIDMEGRPHVDATVRSAVSLAAGGTQVTLALQTYLDRTPGDLVTCMNAGITVRLVKGTYLGDTEDFVTIQEWFRKRADTLIAAGIPFSAATHDPELIAWLREEVADRRELLEFAFLKGLADRTKIAMVADGWRVAEYVPYGPGGQGYRDRRERYIKTLERLGRAPVP